MNSVGGIASADARFVSFRILTHKPGSDVTGEKVFGANLAPAYSVPTRGTKGVIIVLVVQTEVETPLFRMDRARLQRPEILRAEFSRAEISFQAYAHTTTCVRVHFCVTSFSGTRLKIIVQTLRAFGQIHLSVLDA